MEYADGGNLCSYVKRRKRLDEGEARRVLQQLLEGVSGGVKPRKGLAIFLSCGFSAL